MNVPLVQHDRGGAAGLHRELRDPQVLGGDAVAGVAHDQRHVRALGGALGAQRGVVLDRVRDLRLAAHPGGVDEHQLALADQQRHVDRVTRGAGDIGDDHPLLAEEAVDERGLAHIRPADDRKAHRVRVGLVVGGRAQIKQLDDPVEQVARAEALGGGDGERLAEAEAMELGGERQLGDAVALVRRHDHRQRASGAADPPSPRRRGAPRRARRPRAPPPARPRAPRAPGRGSSRRADLRLGSQPRPCRSA